MKTLPTVNKYMLNGQKVHSATNTVTSQGTTLSQLTKQVLETTQSHKSMMEHFDQLATQMAQLIASSASSPKNALLEAITVILAIWHDA